MWTRTGQNAGQYDIDTGQYKCHALGPVGRQATNKSDKDNDGELREHVEKLLQANPLL